MRWFAAATAYAGNQVRAVRRFLRWLAFEEDRPDPAAGMRAPKPEPGLVPVFTSEELSALRRACQGRSFEARCDAAIIEVFLATGIRRSEMAGIRCDPDDPQRSDLSLQDRTIRIRGKAGKDGAWSDPYHRHFGEGIPHPCADVRSCRV